MLRSDSEAERMVAANKMYQRFRNGGGHPDDWELYKKGTAPKSDALHDIELEMARNNAAMADSLRQGEGTK